MSIALSTGYKSLILGPNAWDVLFHLGQILVFQGTRPASPDAPHDSVLLGAIQRTPGPGLTFGREGPYCFKPLDHLWQLNLIFSGTASWCRLVGAGDDGSSASVELPRIDGDVEIASETPSFALLMLDLPSLDLVVGQPIGIDSFLYMIP